MDTILLLIKISCVSLVVTQFEPFQNLKRMINKYRYGKTSIGWMVWDIFNKVTNCAKCTTFWSSLIVLPMVGFNIYDTITFASIATIQSQILYKLSQVFFVKD